VFLRDPTELGPPYFYLKTETDPVSEKLCFFKTTGRLTESIFFQVQHKVFAGKREGSDRLVDL
jgi:hypothetical protein